MKKNINRTERIIRGVTGLALTGLAFWGPKKKIFLAGLLPVFTGATGTCPVYSALNISTRTDDKGFGDGYFHRYQAGKSSGIEGYEPISAPELAAGHPIVGVV